MGMVRHYNRVLWSWVPAAVWQLLVAFKVRTSSTFPSVYIVGSHACGLLVVRRSVGSLTLPTLRVPLHSSPSPTASQASVSATVSFGTTRSRSPSFLPPTGSPATLCGNGVCELTHLATAGGETCGNCPADCGPCQTVDDVSGCVEQGVFSLTIDDGPSLGTPQLLTNLAAQNVNFLN